MKRKDVPCSEIRADNLELCLKVSKLCFTWVLSHTASSDMLTATTITEKSEAGDMNEGFNPNILALRTLLFLTTRHRLPKGVELNVSLNDRVISVKAPDFLYLALKALYQGDFSMNPENRISDKLQSFWQKYDFADVSFAIYDKNLAVSKIYRFRMDKSMFQERAYIEDRMELRNTAMELFQSMEHPLNSVQHNMFLWGGNKSNGNYDIVVIDEDCYPLMQRIIREGDILEI